MKKTVIIIAFAGLCFGCSSKSNENPYSTTPVTNNPHIFQGKLVPKSHPF